MICGIEQGLNETIRLLKKARNVLFITGAGISADSGLPTYRGIGGLYETTDVEDGIPIEMAMAGEMLETRPEITWKYLAQIEQNCRNATFNAAHKTIAQMESHFERVLVLTQNVDGFHKAAGSKRVIEIHGNFHNLKCIHCDWRETVQDYRGLSVPPRCPACGHIVRPDVVFFGEMLDPEKIQIYLDELHKGFDVYFWIGTTGVFPYIQRPIYDIRTDNRAAIEINPGETILSPQMDVRIPLKAAEALQKIWRGIMSSNNDMYT